MRTSPQVASSDGLEARDEVDVITVFGPASLSNLGPGFDTLGLCLDDLGDFIDAWAVDEPGVHVSQVEGAVEVTTPDDPERNTAAVAALAVLREAGADFGMALRLRKGITIGSGIGSSAASAVAGAWAANALLGKPFDKAQLVGAVLEGEAVASGGRHGDNVLPALLGGLVLVSSSDPTRYRRIELPRTLPIALVQPKLQILTRQAREMLPDEVPLRDAVHNASELAFMLDAFRRGDWAAVGQHMMQDRLVEPQRAKLVPCYHEVRQAALDAGALGCALTGSGPAMFALAETDAAAARIVDAMIGASRHTGIDATGVTTQAGPLGVHVVKEEQ